MNASTVNLPGAGTESFSLKNPRLDHDLQPNELRDYLANKLESGKFPSLPRAPAFRNYGAGFPHKPRILLISPAISIPRYMQKRCIPPLGLSYVAASLNHSGYEVQMLDCCVEGYDCERFSGGMLTYGLLPSDAMCRITPFYPDVIGVSVLFSNDLGNVLDLCCEIKKRLPKVPIVLGGLHPTIYPQEVFLLAKSVGGETPCIDWIIRGEGEYRLPQFLENLESGVVDVNQDGLVGVIDGTLICNHQYATIPDLDKLPFPAYQLLPMEKYFQINVPFSPVPKGSRVSQILTSRGCPVSCSFCASTNLYKQYRHRSPQNVLEEIKFLVARYRIDEIQFADDNLTLLPKHTDNLLESLKEADLPWCTPNGTMVNTLNRDSLRKMRDAGLYQITLSIDSGSAKTLADLHHKPVNLSRVPDLIKECETLGVWTHGTLVVGMPGETLESIKDGLEFVKRNLHFTSISTFIAQPIPGSELFHQALEEGLIERSEALKTDSTKCKMRLDNINSNELEVLVMEFQERFTEQARLRDPEVYKAKYGRLLTRGTLKPESRSRLT